MKSVLFVVFDLEIGGAEWVMVNLCNEFVKNKINVTLLTNRNAPLLSKLDHRVEITYCNGNYPWNLLDITGHLLKNRKYNSVIATARETSGLLSLAHLFSRSNANLVIREAASNFEQSLQRTSKIKRFILI